MTGIGPLWRVDGPLPLAPQYGLLQAARSPVVRIIPNDEGPLRWGGGAQIYPYPPDAGHGFDSCSVYGSTPTEKEEGSEIDLPIFDALTVYLAETCSSFGIGNDAEFRARAVAALAAVEGRVVEREFMAGDVFPGSPHLADGAGDFPNGTTATSVVDAFATLEEVIADSGRQGLIHCSPAVATKAASELVLETSSNGVLRTIGCGTVVIPGQGYAGDASDPAGAPAAAAKESWVYATGPVDVRRSDVEVVPGTLAEALDRAMNVVTYRAERYYLVDWDTAVQAAVLVDRCSDECAGS